MNVNPDTLVSSLLTRYPYVEDVFDWHGLVLEDRHRAMSLHALCWLEDLDLEQVLEDVFAVIRAHDENEWVVEMRVNHRFDTDEVDEPVLTDEVEIEDFVADAAEYEPDPIHVLPA